MQLVFRLGKAVLFQAQELEHKVQLVIMKLRATI